MYYLTYTARRKNPKRHIAEKSKTIDILIAHAKKYNTERYIIEIYNSKWELKWSGEEENNSLFEVGLVLEDAWRDFWKGFVK